MKLIVCLALLVSTASAAEVSVHDGAGVVTSAQRANLERASARWPFRLRLFTGTWPARGDLDRRAGECVSAPDLVCVGVDPHNRRTATHFGTATGVRPSDYNLVAAAGNARFKSGDWGGGAEAIADRALESAESAKSRVTVAVQPAAPVVVERGVESGISGWWILLGLVGLGALAWAVVRLARRQRRLDRDMGSYREERDEYMNANVDRMTRPSPAPRTTPGPAPAPARSTVEHHRHDHAGVILIAPVVSAPAPAPASSPAPSVSDAGGSSSSWSSSSSDYDSSSSSDSGGGSSDFGGGFDSGGGGFDGGGGGGDF